MPHVVFRNPGEMDPRCAKVLGVNIKDDEDTAIGIFGNGLKFAQAILVREGISLTFLIGERTLPVGVAPVEIRGKEFALLTLGGEELGFTTDLGKTWKLWQAYRELHSNMLDEGGQVEVLEDFPTPEAGVTQIVVEGEAFLEQYRKRDAIFLPTSPICSLPGTLEIHQGRGEPALAPLFYKGVRVARFPDGPVLYYYNLLDGMNLTEDRTVSEWDVRYELRHHLLQIDDEEVLENILTCSSSHYEYSLDINKRSVSATCLEVLNRLANTTGVSISQCGRSILSATTPFVPKGMALSHIQTLTLARAVQFCITIGYQVDRYQIVTTETLGPGVLGRAESKTIQISRQAFDGGTKVVAGTLLEEFFHLSTGHADCTRPFQNHLIDQLVTVGEEVFGEPI